MAYSLPSYRDSGRRNRHGGIGSHFDQLKDPIPDEIDLTSALAHVVWSCFVHARNNWYPSECRRLAHLCNRQSVCEECCGRAMEIKLQLLPSHGVPLIQRVFEDNWVKKMLRHHVKSLSHSDNKPRHGKPVQEGWRISPGSDIRAPLAPLYHEGVFAGLRSQGGSWLHCGMRTPLCTQTSTLRLRPVLCIATP